MQSESLKIDDHFIQKQQKYRTAKQLFGSNNRESVKLLKIIGDERDKRERLLKFTNYCTHLLRSYRKCLRGCKYCRI